MAFVPISNCAMIELLYTIDNQYLENTFYYAGNDISNPVVLLGLANDAYTQWAATFRQIQSTGTLLRGIRATSLEQQNSPGVEIVAPSPNTGLQGQQTLPNNVTAAISFLTPYRGRSYRGRIFLPGLNESQVAVNTIDATLRSNIDGLYSYWDFLDVSGEPYAQVVASRYHNGQPRVSGIYTPVDSWRTSQYVASQRRRLPGRGR